jgi:succinate dehydrogenase/fumarate reductase flavoprotein subunit
MGHQKTSSGRDTFDLIVVGGGVAGLFAALAPQRR